MNPLTALRHHVTGAIERGEAVAIAGLPTELAPFALVYEVFNHSDGISGRVYSNGARWVARLHDLDSGETLPTGYRFASEDEAKRKANALAFGLDN